MEETLVKKKCMGCSNRILVDVRRGSDGEIMAPAYCPSCIELDPYNDLVVDVGDGLRKNILRA